MKFDFSQIDPLTGLPRIIEREEDNINLMLRLPARSCYVRLLQNRTNLRSVGNLRYAVRLWYDVRTKTLHKAPNSPILGNWYNYRLTCGQKPAGWIED